MGAGSTVVFRGVGDRRQIDPYGRGEHSPAKAKTLTVTGSSPRARGTHQHEGRHEVGSRFIPAGAGNTSARTRRLLSSAVHPRGRGEHAALASTTSTPSGSSPRARGTRRAAGHDRGGVRFIPAGAGNTALKSEEVHKSPVHPRGRGEHVELAYSYRRRYGSSPRARGTLHLLRRKPRPHRFIPAGAGNTMHRPPPASRRAVHPRGRGEHICSHICTSFSSGSSPRARGTPLPKTVKVEPRRFIPAGAGNTCVR